MPRLDRYQDPKVVDALAGGDYVLVLWVVATRAGVLRN